MPATIPPPPLTATTPIFVYGTLMAPEVLSHLLGRVPPLTKPAFLPGYNRWKVINQVFPGIRPCEETTVHSLLQQHKGSFGTWRTKDFQKYCRSSGGGVVEGALLSHLTATELQILDWFEGQEYVRRTVPVWIPPSSSHNNNNNDDDMTQGSGGGAREECCCEYSAQVYVWNNPTSELCIGTGDGEWSYEAFRREHLEWYLENTVQWCRKELDQLNIGVIDGTM